MIFDRFGARIFQPIVIWLCQRTGATQLSIFREGWAVGLILCFLIAYNQHVHWAWLTIIGVITVSNVVMAALRAPTTNDGTKPFNLFLRIGFMAFAVLDIFDLFYHGATRVRIYELGEELFILLAEYALTVHTIPPTKVKEPKRKLVEQV